jgi:hypothetical protein
LPDVKWPRPAAERFLSWILLLPIGVTGPWAGAFHVFFPATAAALIGWEVSPFQFEVGMADLDHEGTCVMHFASSAPSSFSPSPSISTG